MVLVPRMGLSPLATLAGASRYPVGEPLAAVDPAPLVQIDQHQMLPDEERAFRFEGFDGPNERRTFGDRRASGHTTASRPRALFAGLLAEPTQSFVEAFAAADRPRPAGPMGNRPALADMSHGITSYEHIDQVVHGGLPEMGTNLSMML